MIPTNEELKRYDTIVGTVVTNVFSEAARTNNEIYLKWFDPSIPSHRVYFHGAIIGATIFKNKVNLDMPFHKYIWFKLTHWKNRKQFKHINVNKVPSAATQVQLIINHMEQFYEIPAEDKSIWQNILDVYYEPKKGETNESDCD